MPPLLVRVVVIVTSEFTSDGGPEVIIFVLDVSLHVANSSRYEIGEFTKLR
jgi:hypothetical protein